MTDIGRNRKILGSLAAIAVVAGLVMLSGMTKPSPTQPAALQTTTGTAENSQSQPQQFSVRDYSEFNKASDIELPSSDWFGLIGGMVLKLGLVLGLIYAAFIVLRRYFTRNKTVVQGKKPISLLSSLNLSPSRTVYVLEVGKRVLVVGATQNQLSLLTEVTDPETVDEVRTQSAESSAAGQFSSFLSVAKRQFGARENSSGEGSTPNPLQDKFDDGLEFMQDKLTKIRKSLRRK